jgi:hypothetical protein
MDASHPDRVNLLTLLGVFTRQMEALNIRQGEHKHKLQLAAKQVGEFEILQQFLNEMDGGEHLLKTGRTKVGELKCRSFTTAAHTKYKRMMVFVMNDIVVVSERKAASSRQQVTGTISKAFGGGKNTKRYKKEASYPIECVTVEVKDAVLFQLVVKTKNNTSLEIDLETSQSVSGEELAAFYNCFERARQQKIELAPEGSLANPADDERASVSGQHEALEYDNVGGAAERRGQNADDLHDRSMLFVEEGDDDGDGEVGAGAHQTPTRKPSKKKATRSAWKNFKRGISHVTMASHMKKKRGAGGSSKDLNQSISRKRARADGGSTKSTASTSSAASHVSPGGGDSSSGGAAPREGAENQPPEAQLMSSRSPQLADMPAASFRRSSSMHTDQACMKPKHASEHSAHSGAALETSVLRSSILQRNGMGKCSVKSNQSSRSDDSLEFLAMTIARGGNLFVE